MASLQEAPEELIQPSGALPAVDELLPRKIPGIDLVLGLKRLGNAQLYKNILLRFVEKYPAMAESISTLIEQQHWDEASRALHTLKGVVGTICAQELFELTVNLENACQAQQVSPDLLVEFTERYAALIQALQTHLPPSPQPPETDLSEAFIIRPCCGIF